jgi:hypothetical protein
MFFSDSTAIRLSAVTNKPAKCLPPCSVPVPYLESLLKNAFSPPSSLRASLEFCFDSSLVSAGLSVVEEGTHRESARTGVAQVRLVTARLVANFFRGLVGALQGSILLDVALRRIGAEIRHVEEIDRVRSC